MGKLDSADVGAVKSTIEQGTTAFIPRDWELLADVFTNDGVWMEPKLEGKPQY